MIPLSEKLLADAGGWAAMKEARALLAAGKVLEATYTGENLIGRVRGGELDYRSGLTIRSKSDIENTCTCADSRRRALICAHSLAVGLGVLKGLPAASPTPKVSIETLPVAPAKPKVFSLTEGEPCAIHVILPPQFQASWEKGSLMAVFEAEIGGNRRSLGSLDSKKTYRVDAADERLADLLLQLSPGKLPGMVTCSRAEMLRLLSSLQGHPRVMFGKSRRVDVARDSIAPKLSVEKTADGVRLRLESMPGLLLSPPENPWALTNDQFQPVAQGLPAAYGRLFEAPVTIPEDAAQAFLRAELPTLAKFFEIQGAELNLETSPAVPPVSAGFALQLEGSLNHLVARLEATYGDKRITLDATGAATAKFARDRQAEHRALERLRAFGFAGPDGKGELILKGEPKILNFFAGGLSQLQREWKVAIGERFQHVTRNVERVEPRLEIVSSGEQWFDLKYELSTPGGDRFSGPEIMRLLQAGQSHVKRPNGGVVVFNQGLLDEFEQLLRDSAPKQLNPGIYRLDRREAGTLAAFTAEQGLEVAGKGNWRDWVTQSGALEKLRPIPLGNLEAVLRPYQKHGVFWLNFLAQNHLGGLLADDMGLGKTVQTLGFLRTLRGKGPSLIVCPSSLIFNWRAEAERWTPELKVLTLEGANRAAQFRHLDSADLVITSYPLLQRDLPQYGNREFTAAILDEAQRIKNPDTQTAKAAFSIRANHRFALTGTPVENTVRDLWSVMNFLLPGYLGTRNEFKERYERPIQTDPNGPEAQRLKRRVRPFLLRRTKQVVAKDLPEKLEQVSYCELTPLQKTLYRQIAEATRRQVAELASEKDAAKARMTMLTALLRLRQTACDLRLLKMEQEPEADQVSGKMELLAELIEEAREGDHRVLIFSQFVSMLKLIQERLEAEGVEFCYLDGQTKDRQAQVEKFQTGRIPVFLISLKAGGTGLNLTAADTVIHFDPWWNPAVEAQATDRAHRIGQTKIVTSYKLIARDTVEEKILNLQGKKRAMAATAVDDEQPLMDGLTMEDIRGLLK